MMIKTLTPEEALARNNERTNNWAFTFDAIRHITEYQIPEKERNAKTAEIKKTQLLLKSYKTAFGLKTNKELFEHMKNKSNYENDINYEYLQQYILATYSIIQGKSLLKPHTERQYIQDRFFAEMTNLLTPLVIKAEKKNEISQRARNNGLKSGHNYWNEFVDDTKTNPNSYVIKKRGDRTKIYTYMKKHLCILDKRTSKKYLDEYLSGNN